MKKRTKKNYHLKTLIIFITLILLTLFFFYTDKKTFSFASKVKDITSTVTNKAESPFESFLSSLKNRTRFNNLNYENKNLEAKLNDLKITETEIEMLKQELSELKSLLKLKNSNTDTKKVFAKVTLRNPEFWNKTIVIDKGTKDKIKVGDAVITEHGLIGMITDTATNSATIRLITDSSKENQISVEVKKNKKTYQGIIKNYQNDIFEIEGMTNYDGVKIGDNIYTTGLGNFPSDLYIGTVTKIKQDQYGISKILEVTPKQNMNQIRYVAVLVTP